MNNHVKLLFRVILLLVFILSTSYVIYYPNAFFHKYVLRKADNDATEIAALYVNVVWTKYDGIGSAIATSSLGQLLSDPNTSGFMGDSQKFMTDVSAVRINLYDLRSRGYYATNKCTIHDASTENFSLLDKISDYLLNIDSNIKGEDYGVGFALAGTAYSQIISRALLCDDNDINSSNLGTVIQVFVPIIINPNTPNKQIVGALEIVYDVTSERSFLSRLQITSIIAIMVMFLVFLVLLYCDSLDSQLLLVKEREINQELEEAKAKAEAESDNKSKFLANISHELRTPLNAIIGFSEVIKSEAMGPVGHPQYKDYINDIYNSGTHLLSLINDILDYSKAEANKLQVDAIEVDVTKILQVSLRLVQPRAEDAKVTLVNEIPKESFIIIADPKRLKQAVLNLLSNSVKFTPEGGKVTLKAWVEKFTLFVQVIDTGIGIADKDIAKALSIFGQIDSKLSRKYEGTGLGLPLTKKLVELMGGKFDIISETGFGTTITLSFPYDVKLSNQQSESKFI